MNLPIDDFIHIHPACGYTVCRSGGSLWSSVTLCFCSVRCFANLTPKTAQKLSALGWKYMILGIHVLEKPPNYHSPALRLVDRHSPGHFERHLTSRIPHGRYPKWQKFLQCSSPSPNTSTQAMPPKPSVVEFPRKVTSQQSNIARKKHPFLDGRLRSGLRKRRFPK